MVTEADAPSLGALQAGLERALEQLGTLANPQSHGLLPPALQSALDHTLACIAEDAGEQGDVDLDSSNATRVAVGGAGESSSSFWIVTPNWTFSALLPL